MASGNFLAVFRPQDNEPPASNFATFDTRNSVPVLDFDDATDESAVFGGVLPANYSGGGLTVTLVWMATSATSGGVSWDVSIEAHPDDAFDIDADGFATANNSGSAITASELQARKLSADTFDADPLSIFTALIKVINIRLPQGQKITKAEMIAAIKEEIN